MTVMTSREFNQDTGRIRVAANVPPSMAWSLWQIVESPRVLA
jgi:hypothetical protein